MSKMSRMSRMSKMTKIRKISKMRKSCEFLNTVKSLYNCHPWDQKKWPFERGA